MKGSMGRPFATGGCPALGSTRPPDRTVFQGPSLWAGVRDGKLSPTGDLLLPGSRYRRSARTMSTMMTITTTVPMPIYMWDTSR